MPVVTRVLLALLCCAAACKREPRPDPQTARPAVDRGAPPPVLTPVGQAASQPAPEPASQPASTQASASAPASRPSGPSLRSPSPLTPKLEAVVRALKSQKGVFRIRDELAKHLPGAGKDLPEEASVEILEVRKSFLVMAFLRATPGGHKECDENGPQREVRLLYVSEARVAVEGVTQDLLFFDGKKVKVTFPAIADTVPVIEVHYEYEPSCPSSDEESGKKVELFHLATLERIGDPISLGTTRSVPGNDKSTHSSISWLKAKAPGTALLAVTELKNDVIIPCTGEPDDRSAACRNQQECERTTRVFVVKDEGAEGVEDLSALKRSERALSKLPPDRSGRSEAACRRLEPQ